jgi:radical SAM superfamily enzyme YgiQ (UPF0313 family)
MLAKLKEAGCIRVHYGVESGVQKVLDNLQKGITINQIEQAFKITKKIGMETLAYFMIGNPGETKKDIKETIKFTKKLEPDYIHATITMPFPATDLYLRYLNKFKYNDIWQEFAENPTILFSPPVWTECLTKQELIIYVKKMYHKFYFRPVYLLKQLKSVNSIIDLKMKIKMALSMLKM